MDTASAMAQNVEVLDRLVEAFNRGDGRAFDELLAPDAKIFPMRAELEGTVYRGSRAGSQFIAAAREVWDELEANTEEVRGEGDSLLAIGSLRGRARQSGVEVEVRIWSLCVLREGRLTLFRPYLDPKPAFEAAGLREGGVADSR
jgi:ketosteroid isomerase-like protein